MVPSASSTSFFSLSCLTSIPSRLINGGISLVKEVAGKIVKLVSSIFAVIRSCFCKSSTTPPSKATSSTTHSEKPSSSETSSGATSSTTHSEKPSSSETSSGASSSTTNSSKGFYENLVQNVKEYADNKTSMLVAKESPILRTLVQGVREGLQQDKSLLTLVQDEKDPETARLLLAYLVVWRLTMSSRDDLYPNIPEDEYLNKFSNIMGQMRELRDMFFMFTQEEQEGISQHFISAHMSRKETQFINEDEEYAKVAERFFAQAKWIAEELLVPRLLACEVS